MKENTMYRGSVLDQTLQAPALSGGVKTWKHTRCVTYIFCVAARHNKLNSRKREAHLLTNKTRQKQQWWSEQERS